MIYFNGDSHTEGEGLADYLLTGYPGNIKERWTAVSKKWIDDRRKMFYSDLTLFKRVNQENRKLCWAATASENKDFLNSARGGSSLFNIVANSIIDLEKIDNVTHVFIGLPDFSRLHLITKLYKELDYWIYDATPSSLEHVNKDFIEFFKQSWITRSDEDLLIHYLFEMTSLNTYVFNKFKIYPIYINFGLDIKNCISILENGTTNVGAVWLKTSRLLEVDINFNDFYLEEGYTCDGHYTKTTHDNFAKYIKERFF